MITNFEKLRALSQWIKDRCPEQPREGHKYGARLVPVKILEELDFILDDIEYGIYKPDNSDKEVIVNE